LSIPTSGASHCSATVTNFGSVAANVNVDVSSLDKGLAYSNVSAPATSTGKTVHWNGTLSPAVPPQITSITPTVGPAGGYLPLSLFAGITPVTGVGDDTISNFTVPTFYYGGEPYTSIGVVSNGYVVIGGGTSADVQFNPQHFPNAGRPNNVVAPFWNDMDPPSGGTIRVGTLTGGGRAWLVIDWESVKNFSNATTHTGEIWVQLASGAAGTGPASEEFTISYALANSTHGDPGSGINFGAENRTGTSGANIAPAPADNTEWAVNTLPPAAGGTVSFTFDASAKKAGTYRSVAEMTSDVTPGTTQVIQTINVGP
jgi:hypothetical protein